jgi:ribonuclease R
VEPFGVFVQGLELPAEGLVRVESLVDDFYRFDRQTHSLTGYRSGNRFRLGDKLDVVVARVDLERRELDFRVVGREKPPLGPARPGRSAAGDGRAGGRAGGRQEEPRKKQAKPPRPTRRKRRR